MENEFDINEFLKKKEYLKHLDNEVKNLYNKIIGEVYNGAEEIFSIRDSLYDDASEAYYELSDDVEERMKLFMEKYGVNYLELCNGLDDIANWMPSDMMC